MSQKDKYIPHDLQSRQLHSLSSNNQKQPQLMTEAFILNNAAYLKVHESKPTETMGNRRKTTK